MLENRIAFHSLNNVGTYLFTSIKEKKDFFKLRVECD